MIAAVLTALIALAVVGAVAWPLVAHPARDAAADDSAARELDAQIEASMCAIRDLAFDHRAGNLSDEDFTAMDRAERANAARLLRRREAASRSS